MDELTDLLHSDDLRKAASASSKRWLDDDKWRPIAIEEYVDFLDAVRDLKKELNAPELPHPRMKGEKFSI